MVCYVIAQKKSRKDEADFGHAVFGKKKKIKMEKNPRNSNWKQMDLRQR